MASLNVILYPSEMFIVGIGLQQPNSPVLGGILGNVVFKHGRYCTYKSNPVLAGIWFAPNCTWTGMKSAELVWRSWRPLWRLCQR